MHKIFPNDDLKQYQILDYLFVNGVPNFLEFEEAQGTINGFDFSTIASNPVYLEILGQKCIRLGDFYSKYLFLGTDEYNSKRAIYFNLTTGEMWLDNEVELVFINSSFEAFYKVFKKDCNFNLEECDQSEFSVYCNELKIIDSNIYSYKNSFWFSILHEVSVERGFIFLN